uniref:Uncharacterized protein n=1 Tax=Lactuca sativa TaxID=4236 RepID=A0A9R1V8Z8_LACSA|nr:hypothetical protein LSAT_V11C600313220 [Lactuca sativa]
MGLVNVVQRTLVETWGSRRNSALATLDGIDVMGSRLADELRLHTLAQEDTDSFGCFFSLTQALEIVPVGWSTSSIRHQIQLPKIKNLVRSGRYPNILKEDAKNITK